MTAFSVGVAKSCHFRNTHPAIWAKQTQLVGGLMRGGKAEMFVQFDRQQILWGVFIILLMKVLILYNKIPHWLAWSLVVNNCKSFIRVLFCLYPPQPLTVSLLLTLAFVLLFFRLPTSLLSSPVAFLPSVVRLRPCLADDPTPDPMVARRIWRIASLPVGGEATGIDLGGSWGGGCPKT